MKELDDKNAQAMRSILEGLRALLLTEAVTSSMVSSQPAFADLIDASSPRSNWDLLRIVEDQLTALS